MQNPRNVQNDFYRVYKNLSPTYFLYKPNLETNLRQNESLVLGSKHVLGSLIMAPHDLKLHRVMSNTNTNRFQVVWDRSGRFLENVHFCSFYESGTLFKSRIVVDC